MFTLCRVTEAVRRWSSNLVALGAFALGCASGEALPTAPVAVLGQSAAAQQAYRSLEQAWYEGSDRERQQLEPRLAKFVESHSRDPEARQVQVWLGWLCVSKGRLDAAQSLAEKASADKIGSTFDTAQVLKAAILTRRGQPDQSLRLLEPLSGQIVDSRERDTWAREIILAALRLKHDDDALKWALVWRLDSSEDRRASIDREIGIVLDQVSRPALDRLWSQLVTAERIPTTSPSRKQGRIWMREAVLQRLARFAIDSRDGSLARRLLNDAWLPLQKNSSLRRLARVAAKGEVELQSLTRAVGVILELDDAQERRRSSELLTGVLQTLDEVAGQNPVHLRTREALRTDRQGYADAVEDLYNEGVALLIGGFEPASASELAKNARTKMLPVITLSRLEKTDQYESSFWIDTSDGVIVQRWLQSLPGSVDSSKVVTDDDAICSTQDENPFEPWLKGQVDRVLLTCGAVCAEKLGQTAFDAARLPAIWLGPKAAEAQDSWRSEQVKGRWIFARLVEPRTRNDGLDNWQKRFSRLPSYFETIGHDVALLAAASLGEFPSQVAPDPDARRRVLRELTARLASVHVSLWSSESPGFAADHSLQPNFIIQSQKAKQSRPAAGPDARRSSASHP